MTQATIDIIVQAPVCIEMQQLGAQGLSAYAVAVGQGFVGTEAEWLESLVGTTSWDGIVDKPSTFPPSAHEHAIADVTGLQGALDAKQPAGDYAPSVHTHAIADVTGLSDALSDKVAVTFETVSKNLSSKGATLAYTGGELTSITYANGIVKTLDYAGGDLVSVTLSGATPDGISFTKTLAYTDGDLTGVSYA